MLLEDCSESLIRMEVASSQRRRFWFMLNILGCSLISWNLQKHGSAILPNSRGRQIMDEDDRHQRRWTGFSWGVRRPCDKVAPTCWNQIRLKQKTYIWYWSIRCFVHDHLQLQCEPKVKSTVQHDHDHCITHEIAVHVIRQNGYCTKRKKNKPQ